MPFTHDCFETYEIEKIPLHRDLYIRDIEELEEWEAAYISLDEGRGGDPYRVGYVSRAAATSVGPAGIEISWFPNVFDRFHEVKTFLPRDAFVAAVLAWNYDKRPTIFVRSDWLTRLHLRSNSVFAMIDAAGMTQAIEAGRLTRYKLLDLRDRIDAIAAVHTSVSFISFADSLLLKTNWVAGMAKSGVTYNYNPEALILIFRELRAVYRAVFSLDIYGVFAQGSNEYYDDPLLHVSASKNHISLNSLGLPFAQIMQIEAAARTAIRRGEHQRYELYLDEDFFRSLQFSDYKYREKVRSAPYKPKMTKEPGSYHFHQCDDLLRHLKLP
jgi:hypothetical protein